MAILAGIRESLKAPRCVARLGRILVWGALAAIPSIGQVAEEYHVKAAFLYNFARFVEWPSTTFRSPQDPFAICILGADPFGGTLKETVAGKQIEGRDFRILHISEAAQANACQILFIGSSERKRIAATIAALPAAGVLTVGEMDGFAAAGGIVNFTLNEGHVRFQVNPHAAERAKLQISSRMLSLAQIVGQ
ncbi:MAG TPA: YfiR family protein [Bryobacteraceae bacterium]|jgi:hypothetical protein|nr:YfiR family protein [Bryobacteraceae bacterium]